MKVRQNTGSHKQFRSPDKGSYYHEEGGVEPINLIVPVRHHLLLKYLYQARQVSGCI